MKFEPKKLYYRIGEVCEIVGVEAHVLRYWETEFPRLAPPKNKSGQRTYRPKDIELLLRIRKLLYEDGFTIAGARKQLTAGGPPENGSTASAPASPKAVQRKPSPSEAPSQRLRQLRKELENILTLLDRE
jgi:DNA-binding transcriptional MerR regulator